MPTLIDWTQFFPNLSKSGYKRTSCPTGLYNCFAWAANDDQQRWDPDPWGLFFWPKEAPRKLTKTAIIAAYGTVGFKVCASPDLKDGLEKIAVYCSGATPLHAARQLPSGKWTSKLGDEDDIEHTLDGLNDAAYGNHKIYMSRKLTLPA